MTSLTDGDAETGRQQGTQTPKAAKFELSMEGYIMTDEQDKDLMNQVRTGKIEIRTGGQDAPTTVDMPLRLLVLGDFTPESPGSSDWSESSHLIRVDKDNFQTVMQQLNPCLSLDVPNRLSEQPRELTVNLHFPEMKAFRPEGIAQQVDVLAKLLEIRQLANQLEDQEIALSEFEGQLQQIGADVAWIEQLHQLIVAQEAADAGEQPVPRNEIQPKPTPAAPPRPEPSKKDTGLDALWDMVDLGDEQVSDERSARTTASRAVDGLVRAIVQPQTGGQRADRSIAQTIIDDINEMLGKQINEILHHDKFQRLESAWRGLKFLINRTDFRENIIVELLDVHKDDLRDAIHHQVFTPEYNDLTDTPLSVIIADYEFNRSPVDIELLGEIAEMVAGMQVPFIGSVGPEFFGLQTAEELSRLPGLHAYFQKPEYTQWRSLRDKETTKYLALTAPRFLLRFPYGSDGEPVKGFQFTEHTGSSSHYLWGRGSFAVATTLVRSFIEHGWCTRITGLRGGGIVENLPVWGSRTAGRGIRIPLDVLFPQSKELEFADAGLVLLGCRMNDDKAYVLSAPTVHRPKRYSTEEATAEAQLHATLPYQLFATHLAHYLLRLTRDVSTGLTAEQVQALLTAQFQAILAKTGGTLPEEVVTVEVEASKEQPEYYDVVLRIRPPFQILGRNVELFLGLALHR